MFWQIITFMFCWFVISIPVAWVLGRLFRNAAQATAEQMREHAKR